MFEAEIETGMFKKPVEELVKEIYTERLPPEVRAVVIAAWKRGGLLHSTIVEHIVGLVASTYLESGKKGG